VYEIADLQLFHLRYRYNIAGYSRVDRFILGALRLEDVTGPYAFLPIVTQHVRIRLYRAAEEPDCGVFHIRLRIETDTEDHACKRPGGVGRQFRYVLAVFEFSGLCLLRRRRVFCDNVQKLADADLCASIGEDYRDERAGF